MDKWMITFILVFGPLLINGLEYDCTTYCENFAPEFCKCNEGFEIESPIRCRPSCSPKCENGTCVAPNRCECHKGFDMLNGTCTELTCDPSCGNSSTCVLGLCRRIEGYYRLSFDLPCTPKCEFYCPTGQCSPQNHTSHIPTGSTKGLGQNDVNTVEPNGDDRAFWIGASAVLLVVAMIIIIVVIGLKCCRKDSLDSSQAVQSQAA